VALMLELRGAAPGLLDEPLLLEVGGAAPGSTLLWRTRILDDDGFVWRGEGPTLDALRWSAKADGVAALRSLRPVELEVRVEGGDGTATRTLTRTVLDPAVKARRWKEGVTGRLLLPADPVATLLVDGEEPHPLVAAALLASRGVRVFVAASGDPAELPFPDPRRLAALPVPPGLPARDDDAPDGAAWDALLADLAAQPRRVAR
jgi:hypothetical protein